MALRTILTDKDPSLHKHCRPVTSFDGRLHDLIDDLKEKRRYVIKAIGGEKEKANYSKNELDALTCTLYNCNDYDFSKWK